MNRRYQEIPSLPGILHLSPRAFCSCPFKIIPNRHPFSGPQKIYYATMSPFSFESSELRDSHSTFAYHQWLLGEIEINPQGGLALLRKVSKLLLFTGCHMYWLFEPEKAKPIGPVAQGSEFIWEWLTACYPQLCASSWTCNVPLNQLLHHLGLHHGCILWYKKADSCWFTSSSNVDVVWAGQKAGDLSPFIPPKEWESSLASLSQIWIWEDSLFCRALLAVFIVLFFQGLSEICDCRNMMGLGCAASLSRSASRLSSVFLVGSLRIILEDFPSFAFLFRIFKRVLTHSCPL